MVRAILAPKSLEEQFIKRVQSGHDQGLVKQVLTQMRGSTFRVCLCEDGRPGMPSCASSVGRGLRSLYDSWGLAREVEVHTFSFMGDLATMTHLLTRADLFYFAGVHIEVTAPSLNHAMRNRPLLHLLRECIQYNQCAFFGVCGGAALAGYRNDYDLPGLDIFDGLIVQYDANVSPGHVTVATNEEQGILQMTTGCALVFIMDEMQTIGISFPTIKNHTRWLHFAKLNSHQVQRIVDMKTIEWKGYSYYGEPWWFNLRGYIWTGSDMYICRRGVGPVQLKGSE